MHKTNIKNIDLNLFIIFEVVYREGSITRAADFLNLSQPAVSHALGRLRDRLQDPLFIRRGNEMVPTPRAKALVQPVREALEGLQSCLGEQRSFEPANARRTFVLGLRDGMEACVLPPLMQLLAREAPGIDVQSVTVARRDTAAELSAGRLDLAMDIPLPVPADICQHPLGNTPLVVVHRRQHPLARASLTLNQYLAASHVLVSSRRRGPGLEDFGLAQAGHRRHISLRCQHYQSALHVIAVTDLLLTLPDMLATQLVDRQLLSVRKLPTSLPPMGMHLYWHQDLSPEPGHRWLRALLQGNALAPQNSAL